MDSIARSSIARGVSSFHNQVFKWPAYAECAVYCSAIGHDVDYSFYLALNSQASKTQLRQSSLLSGHLRACQAIHQSNLYNALLETPRRYEESKKLLNPTSEPCTAISHPEHLVQQLIFYQANRIILVPFATQRLFICSPPLSGTNFKALTSALSKELKACVSLTCRDLIRSPVFKEKIETVLN